MVPPVLIRQYGVMRNHTNPAGCQSVYRLGFPFTCTLPRGHTGDHEGIAEEDGSLVVWEDTPETVTVEGIDPQYLASVEGVTWVNDGPGVVLTVGTRDGDSVSVCLDFLAWEALTSVQLPDLI